MMRAKIVAMMTSDHTRNLRPAPAASDNMIDRVCEQTNFFLDYGCAVYVLSVATISVPRA